MPRKKGPNDCSENNAHESEAQGKQADSPIWNDTQHLILALFCHFPWSGFSVTVNAAWLISWLESDVKLLVDSLDRGESRSSVEENSGFRVARPIPPAPGIACTGAGLGATVAPITPEQVV